MPRVLNIKRWPPREAAAGCGQRAAVSPAGAVRDALVAFPADRVLIFAHRGAARRYREDVSPSELADDVGVPVEVFDIDHGARRS
jgi:hypothetical protein